jgi:manganese/zinc/iron transport system permease protein
MRRVAVAAAAVLALIAITAERAEPPIFGDVLRLLTLVAVPCATLGAWLVLRRMAMMADAIGHSILLGIVAVYFVVQDPSSPLFVLGAAAAGVLTVLATEVVVRTGLVREDAGIGMVFSFMFALALVVISLFLRGAHVDQHMVLAGGAEFTVLRRLMVAGADWGPRAVATMAAIALAGTALMLLFWKELKLATFDPALAASLGFSPAILNYGLMAGVAVTAVGAFEAMGSILVVALFVAPPACAFLLTDDLGEMVGLSGVLGAAAAWLGFVGALRWNVNFGGSVAVASGLIFGAALVAAPREGLLAQAFRRRRQRAAFALDTLLVHLATHQGTAEADAETNLATLPEHLGWAAERTSRVATHAIRLGLATAAAGRLVLTPSGLARAADAAPGVR